MNTPALGSTIVLASGAYSVSNIVDGTVTLSPDRRWGAARNILCQFFAGKWVEVRDNGFGLKARPGLQIAIF